MARTLVAPDVFAERVRLRRRERLPGIEILGRRDDAVALLGAQREALAGQYPGLDQKVIGVPGQRRLLEGDDAVMAAHRRAHGIEIRHPALREEDVRRKHRQQYQEGEDEEAPRRLLCAED